MKLRLIGVGRGAPELATFEARFIKRLDAFAPCTLIELADGRGRQAVQCKQQEAKAILDKVKKGFVLFDEHGRQMPSEQWAAWFSRQQGDAQLDFVIGGADGVDASVRAAAGEIWSLSKLTLPHQLVRAVALEQFYRAFTIMRGHPYHRP
ncbi:MAG: 23S rRNA (pseudouridine(1915)-N(3))-methyltransferase RlmH [Mariprofundaceae bacterium]|nr:23S rRNA (pseudouridine(1915)-N(3))-methyltransferase RlmH [Mariprofundaceae bacterium]